MTTTMRVSMLASVALLAMAAGTPAQAQQANSMTFFAKCGAYLERVRELEGPR